MAGLSAARDLVNTGRDVLVLELSTRVGGRVETRTVGGLHAELGATFLTNFHRRTLDLVDRSGLSGELFAVRSRSAVINDNSCYLLDLRSPAELARTLPPRTWPGLLRLVAATVGRPMVDPTNIVRAAAYDDQSVDSYTAGLPAQLTRRLLEPALRGFLYWDPATTSRAMLLVLVRAALTLRRILGLRAGLSSLPQALGRDIPIRLGATATLVTRNANSWRVEFTGEGGHEVVEARRVVLATPGHVAARLLARAVDNETLRILTSTRYAAVVTVTHLMPQACAADVAATLISGSPLVLATSASGRAGPGSAGDLVTLYGAERAGRPPALSAVVLNREVCRLAPHYVPVDPLQTVVRPWPAAIPEFPPGRLRDISRLDHDGLARRGLALAGDYLGGPSIEGAVQSGQQAARHLSLGGAA